MAGEGKISPSKFTCTKCKTEFSYYLRSNAYSVICSHCATVYDNSQGTPIARNLSVKIDFNPAIPTGKTGIIKGRRYQVIAASLKKEKGTSYSWEEYILFNPLYGCAYLSQYEGHWTYLELMHESPELIPGNHAYKYDGNEYDLFAKYRTELKTAKGEFTFNLDTGEKPHVEEYICPPYILTREKTGTEYTWYKGEYLQPEEILKAFELKAVPERSGVGVIQPFVSSINGDALRKVSIAIVILLTALQIYFTSTSHDEKVFQQSWFVSDSLNGKELSTNSFQLNYGTKNVEIKLNSNVDNNWSACAITLVNEGNGDIYDLDLETEYYHGYEGGEAWSEGSGWASKVISQVPEGKYHLIVSPQKPSNISGATILVSVTRDVDILSNFIIVIIVLGIFPFIYFNRANSFEKDRWYNSNYSPYDDDDE